ncbi:hypothetical protein M0R04_09390 [Candidatus Dojkabacteria bacterium]|jgi:hypothetical protein|nr:hypothetical protein [Candidatus Dojkabacteria bacterium]
MKTFIKYTGDKKHGMCGTDIYLCWCNMKNKCNAVGSNVKMSYSWNKFENFFSDMGKKPVGCKLTLIDKEKGFIPGNCYWKEFDKPKPVVDYKTIEGRVNSKYGLSAWKPPRGVQYVK